MPKNYVYDKKQDLLIEVNFGEHFSGIFKCVLNAFGNSCFIEKTVEEIDEYIIKNIELKGEKMPFQYYRDNILNCVIGG